MKVMSMLYMGPIIMVFLLQATADMRVMSRSLPPLTSAMYHTIRIIIPQLSFNCRNHHLHPTQPSLSGTLKCRPYGNAKMQGIRALRVERMKTRTKMARLDMEDTKKYGRQNHSEIEKRRRDKMNSYITELSAMVPMCNAMNRKLDKLTVLRMAVQHMKTLRGASNSYTEACHKPSFLSDEELKHLILQAASGFLFVVGCDRGRILYVSESVIDTLNYSQSDLIGQSLFDVLHPKDIGKVKEQLSSSDLSPRERLIDAKTMLPVKTELPQHPTRLCSGARRSFFCRMKCGNKSSSSTSAVKTEKKPELEVCQRKKKSGRKSFSIIHCTGYLKSWSSSRVGLVEEGEWEGDGCNLSCLVAVGRVEPVCSPYNIPDNSHIQVRQTEFVSRHSIDGKFTYIDQRVTVILGYLPQELLGSSVYEYYYQDDIIPMADVHRKVLRCKEKVESGVFRFKTRDGSFLHLRSKSFSFHNPWTKEVEYIVCTNTVVPMQEVTSSSQTSDPQEYSVLMADDNSSDSKMTDLIQRTTVKRGLPIPGVPGGTRAGAGRIGRQIADEIIETQRVSDSPNNADSSNTPGTSNLPNSSQHQTPPKTMSLSQANSSSTSTSNAAVVQNRHGPALGGQNGLNLGRILPNQNGANLQHNGPEEILAIENSLIDIFMNEDMQDLPCAGDEGNDEAAMAVIMSLLEADAGLGGPVDFNDLPWPL
ncbi:protein cycle-like [Liolophura sinensis]|uniref:protein cycle-like n=1 Tax=Liolophura sinensis TaxID=3198878 RepID=UPI003159903A